MLRVVLINLLLFMLPFAIYGGIVLLTRSEDSEDSVWRDAPVTLLVAAGIALVVSVMVFFVSFESDTKGGTYRPAEIRDGKIVPGRVEREE